MSRGYSEDMYPSWVTFTMKLIAFIVLATTLAYLGATAWGIGETIKERPNKNTTEPTSGSASLPKNEYVPPIGEVGSTEWTETTDTPSQRGRTNNTPPPTSSPYTDKETTRWPTESTRYTGSETTGYPTTGRTRYTQSETTRWPSTYTTSYPPTESTDFPPTHTTRYTTDHPPTDTTNHPPTHTTDYPPTDTTDHPSTYTTTDPSTYTTNYPSTYTTPSTPTDSTPDPDRSGIERPDTHEIADLVCASVTIVSLLLQSISTLNVLCNCHGGLKNRTYRWVIIQSILLIIVVLCYLIPFTFQDNGDHSSSSEAWNNTQSHINSFVARTSDFESHAHSHNFWIPFTFFLYFGVVFFGCLAGGVIMACGARDGYKAVR